MSVRKAWDYALAAASMIGAHVAADMPLNELPRSMCPFRFKCALLDCCVQNRFACIAYWPRGRPAGRF